MTVVAARIAEHARQRALASVTVIIHGGEPLLAGMERIRFFAHAVRAALPAGCMADLRIQTNGLRLDEAFCEMFLQEGIGVGVSIDGGRTANDLHRRYADGRTSYPALEKAIRLLGSDRYRPAFNGLLCTVDVANDPVAVFDALAAFKPPKVEFLLPHATWVNPPPAAGTGAPYARWLLAVHRRWIECGRPMDVRLFTSVAELMAGRRSGTEALGLGPAEVVVVETDGEIEQADSLKTAFDGAPSTGFDIVRHSFAEAAAHAGFVARTVGTHALGPECLRCPVVRVCGGGLYAHRYDGTGFAGPSVYCEDLYTFMTAMSGQRAAPQQARHSMGSADFDTLSRGQGSGGAFAVLRAGQTSRARLRLARLARSPAAGNLRAFLEDCDVDDRGLVNRVLADPFLAPEPEEKESPDIVVRTALSCAVLGRRALALDVIVAGDVLALPQVGTLPVQPGPCRVSVEESGQVTVNGEAVEPVRQEARLGPVRLRIEDRDPARDRFGHPVAGPLSEDARTEWGLALAAAAEVLADRHPEALAEMAEVLTTLVPLSPSIGRQSSATARSAFGALAVALPGPGADQETGEALASLLLHEFQHLKLGAVLDMFKLHDGSDTGEYLVGWRDDARSLEAVMQGVYAHLAVAEYWRRRAAEVRHRAEGYSLRAADFMRQVTDALALIGSSSALTPLGKRWIRGMASVVEQWR